MPRPVVDRANWGAAFKAKILVVIVSGPIYIEALEELLHELDNVIPAYPDILTDAGLAGDRPADRATDLKDEVDDFLEKLIFYHFQYL